MRSLGSGRPKAPPACAVHTEFLPPCFMHAPLTLFAAVLFAPAAGDQLALQFKADQTVAQTWSITQKSEVSTASLTVMGNDQDIGSDSVSTRTAEFEVTDTVHEAADGGLSKFTRKFETIDTASDTERNEESEAVYVEEEGSPSPLLGQEVLFTYDGDSGEYDAEYAEGSEGEGDWLDGLRPSESYLGGLLPEEAPAEGDSWEVGPEFLASLLEPLGEVDVEEDVDDDGGPDQPPGAVAITVPSGDDHMDWSGLEGELKATWVKTEEEDGKRIAVIELAVDASGEFDLAEALEEEASERGSEDTFQSAILQRTFEGEVTIRWDLDAGLPMDLEGELTGTTRFFAEWTVSVQIELELTLEHESSDEIAFSAGFEVQ